MGQTEIQCRRLTVRQAGRVQGGPPVPRVDEADAAGFQTQIVGKDLPQRRPAGDEMLDALTTVATCDTVRL